MNEITLPRLKGDLIAEDILPFEFNRPRQLPLVVWSEQLSPKKKDALEVLCGLMDFPHQELMGRDVTTLDYNLEKTWENYQTNSILIIGARCRVPFPAGIVLQSVHGFRKMYFMITLIENQTYRTANINL